MAPLIWRPRHLTRSPREERRLEAARLLQAGRLSQAEIARRLGVSRMAVSQWAKHLRQHPDDLASLKSRPRPGRPPRLTAGQWPHVRQRLTQGTLRAGFETERWTRQRIRALLVVAFGVHDHAHDLARRLKALRWSPQEPTVYAREREEALVQAWLTHDWRRMKKRPAARGLQSCSSTKQGFPSAPRWPRRGLRSARRLPCGESVNAANSLQSSDSGSPARLTRAMLSTPSGRRISW